MRRTDTPSRPAVISILLLLSASVWTSDSGKVVAVTDGDTIKVEVAGRVEKVPLIGVDTPETVHPNKPVEYFGKEASAFTRQMALGKVIHLEEDPGTTNRDKYGRLLRYVFLPDGTLLNAAIIYGPYQFPEKFLPQMILNALEGKPLPIYGDGLYVRDWLHVEDHCAALEAALRRGRPGAIYNIGSDAERANIAVARQVLRLTGRPESLLARVPDRPAHDRRYAIDAGLIRRELGWRPAHDFDRGLEGTVSWYRDHEAWWRRIISGDYLVDRAQARARG